MTKSKGVIAWIRDEKRLIWLEYSALSLIILLPLLLPGYILSIDLVFTPHFAWPNEVTNTYPLQVALWLLYHVMPGDVVEKLVLFAILLFSGVGMHSLIRRIKTDDILSDIWRLAAYFGGIFYMINPFTYSRFMAGQWMVLLGYALLPFFLLALIRLMARPSTRTALNAGAWALAISFVSVHHVGMMVLLGVVIAVVMVVKYWHDKKHIGRFFGYASLAAVGVILVSSFWLVPALLGKNSIGQAVADFNTSDMAAFATNTRSSLGAVGDVVRLQGFWLENRDLFRLPQGMIPMWGLFFLLLWALIIAGAIKAWRQHRIFVILALGCVVIGVLFATTPLVTWLGQVITPLAGYREPHKFVNLVVIGYVILATFGVGYIAQWMSDRWRERGAQGAIIACILLLFVVTPTMMWGFAGQLVPKSYPSEWEQMNDTLKKTVKPHQKVVFLPWHQYFAYSFNERLMANPAEKFFEVPIVAGDDPEFRDISSTAPNKQKQAIGEALEHKDNLAQTLSQNDISYVLLAKEQDEVDYSYLDKLSGLQPVSENTKLKLYKIENK